MIGFTFGYTRLHVLGSFDLCSWTLNSVYSELFRHTFGIQKNGNNNSYHHNIDIDSDDDSDSDDDDISDKKKKKERIPRARAMQE